MTAFTHDDFLTRVVAAFPELADGIDAFVGSPTLQAAALAHRLQRAKGHADWDTYERGIKLVAEFWDQSDEQLERELRWSFIKALDFEGVRGPVAWGYLPLEMQRAWTRSQNYLAKLSALPRKKRKRR